MSFKTSKWSWLWVVWFALFLAIELPAIFNDTPDDTLSEHVWAITSIPFFWWLFAGFFVWLVAHLLGPRTRKWLKSWRK